MEGKLLPSLRNNLARIGCSFELDNAYVVVPQRDHDKWIMDRVILSKRFTKTQMEWINYCRLYLRVTTLSDIVQADGFRIDPAIETGERSMTSSVPKHFDVNQPKPGPRARVQWRRVLRLFSKKNGILRGQRLGKWLYSAEELRHNWHAYLNEATNTLFIRNSRGYYETYAWRPSSSTYRWLCSECSEFQAKHSTPVRATFTNNGWQIQSTSGAKGCPIRTNAQDFESHLKDLDPWEAELFRAVQLHVQPDELWEIETVHNKPSEACDENLIEHIGKAISTCKPEVLKLPSGAGHDVMVMSHLTAAGLIFVRCAGGISHNPAESITTEDAFLGAEVMMQTVLSLDGVTEMTLLG